MIIIISVENKMGQTGCEQYVLLKIVDPFSSLTEIEIRFAGVSQERTSLTFDSWAHGFLCVDNLIAFSDNGKLLPIFPQDKCFIAENGNCRNFTVRYSLRMNQRQSLVGNGPLGFLCGTYLLSQAQWMFLLPNVWIRRVFIKVMGPEGWQAVVLWKEGEKRGVFVESDILRFKWSSFAMGRFEVFKETINGTNEIVAVDREHDPLSRMKIRDDCFSIFKFIKRTFGAKQPDEHLSIFVKANDLGEWQYVNESSESHGEAVVSADQVFKQHSHRIFHTFNSFQPFGMELKSLWFNEGVNTYYETLSGYYAGAGHPSRTLRLIHKEYLSKRHIIDFSLGKMPMRFGPDWEKTHVGVYLRGALVAYLLDVEIRKATKGFKNLGSVLCNLYERYGCYRNGAVTEEIIRDIVSEICGRDMKGFFNCYIDQNLRIEMDNHFDDPVFLEEYPL